MRGFFLFKEKLLLVLRCSVVLFSVMDVMILCFVYGGVSVCVRGKAKYGDMFLRCVSCIRRYQVSKIKSVLWMYMYLVYK